MLCFSLAAFRIVSLFLTFAIFIIICLGVGLFGFNFLGAFCSSYILTSVFFRFGKFSDIISSIIFSIPFSFSSSGIPIMHRLACFILSHRSLIFLSFLKNLVFYLSFWFCDFGYSVFQVIYWLLCIVHSSVQCLQLSFCLHKCIF